MHVVLPDQVPGEGEGEWAEFFGRPAYTMTLIGPPAARLRGRAGVLLRRAPGRRRGFQLHFLPLADPLPADRAVAARQVNAMVEQHHARLPGAVPVGLQPLQASRGRPAAAASSRV